jgi:hypothetical protein
MIAITCVMVVDVELLIKTAPPDTPAAQFEKVVLNITKVVLSDVNSAPPYCAVLV